MIPFVDLKAGTAELRAELDAAYHRFMDSGQYVLGKEVETFEQEYAEYCEAGHCVGVASGLDALTLALRAVNVAPGDEVIVPSNTYIATWLAVTYVGATIVPVDPDPHTFNINADLIAAALTKRTKVILPVNLYGQPINYDPMMELARDNGLTVIVDNAQAQGACYKNRRVGGIAHIECHSFYPTKNLGAYGEAGAVTTSNSDWADAVRLLRNYGSKVRYQNEVCGVNSRIDALQAAFLRVKLRYLDEWNNRRRELARVYYDGLAMLPNLQLPLVPDWAYPVWHLFVATTPLRDELRSALNLAGIGTEIHYPVAPHLSRAYAHLKHCHEDFPIAAKLAGRLVSLPIGPSLATADVHQVAKKVREFFDGATIPDA